MTGFLIAGTASGVGNNHGHARDSRGDAPPWLDRPVFEKRSRLSGDGYLTRISGRSARNLDTWMLDF